MTFFTLITLLFTNIQTADVNKSLQKNWTLISTEEFGSVAEPRDSLIGDFIHLKADGTFSMKHYGETSSGKYNYNTSNKILTCTGTTSKTSFKLMSITNDVLTLEFQHPSLIRTKLQYQIAK